VVDDAAVSRQLAAERARGTLMILTTTDHIEGRRVTAHLASFQGRR